MMRTCITASVIAGLLALGMPSGSAAQNPISAVGKATKDAGKAVAKGTKGVADKAATETKNVGKTVEGAANPKKVSARCKDNTVQTGKTRTDACRAHLGVKK